MLALGAVSPTDGEFPLKCPPLVLFSLITVGFASNALGGAGGPLAVYFV